MVTQVDGVDGVELHAQWFKTPAPARIRRCALVAATMPSPCGPFQPLTPESRVKPLACPKRCNRGIIALLEAGEHLVPGPEERWDERSVHGLDVRRTKRAQSGRVMSPRPVHGGNQSAGAEIGCVVDGRHELGLRHVLPRTRNPATNWAALIQPSRAISLSAFRSTPLSSHRSP
jgi:hypothetical protein